MKKKSSIESKIRLNVIFIYVLVAFFCAGIVFYMYRMRISIEEQKKNIENYNKELVLSDRLVKAINSSQESLNTYLASKDTMNMEKFDKSLSGIDVIVDSLNVLTKNQKRNKSILQIRELLKQKKETASQLKALFTKSDPDKLVEQALREYHFKKLPDLPKVATVKTDTIVKAGPKKTFWKKFKDLFSKKVEKQTIVSVSKTDTAELKHHKQALKDMVIKIDKRTQKEGKNFLIRLFSIEKHVSNLILADQEISSKITALLINFYSDTIKSRMAEIHKNEELVRENNNFSIVGGMFSLLVILIFIVMIISDVNKGFRMRKSLELANKKIKEVMESRHQLLLSVSHDIKTPLNSIMGYLELNENKNKLNANEIKSMKNSSGNILALLNNLLEFSRLEQGKLSVDQSSFDLKALYMEIVGMFQPLAAKKGLEFIHSFGGAPDLYVNSDVLKIKQIIINILSNSIKYTSSGSVEFKCGYKGGSISLDFSDTGAGIPKEYIDKIFQAFERVESNNRLAEGTGLGLYVVKGMVKILNGKINMKSEVGKGTSTHVSLPAEESRKEKKDEKDNNVSKKLLLIDDDETYLQVLHKMLEKLGHRVIECNNLENFESNLKNISRFDGVFTDMEMGFLSGRDVLNRIREKDSRITVIVVSGREDLSETGFTKILKKPVSIESLKEAVGGVYDPAENRAVEQKEERIYNMRDLEEMFGEDKDSICEILRAFVGSAKENLFKLEECVDADDFGGAQFLCHKMLPMFIQVGASEKLIVPMKEMDASRADPSEKHPNWKSEMEFVCSEGKRLIDEIKSDYDFTI